MGELYMETFLNKIEERRKLSLGTNVIQPITAETMAFRMLRQRGIIRKMHDMVREMRSRNFNI